MIDWATILVKYPHHPIPSDKVMKLSPNGDVQWCSSCSTKVRGSYESSIFVKSQGGDGLGEATHIYIDGNPSKFLQGHNVFGSDDLVGMMAAVFAHVKVAFSLPYDIESILAINRGDYEIKRLDINYMYELDNLVSVRSWLQAAELKSKTRHGRAVSSKSTCYWGKSSRRWSIKAYSKFDEIGAGGEHALPKQFHFTPLKKFAENKLRLEVTLRSLELKKIEMDKGSDWTPEKVKDTYAEYIGRIEMNTNATLPDNKVLELPRRLQSSYMLWKQGTNLKQILPKPTFYNHRKGLLEHNIDIAFPCDTPDQSNVVPLLRVLEAKPVSTPDWAHEKRLIWSFEQTGLKQAVGEEFTPCSPFYATDHNVHELTRGL
ncbi:phage/plasmid replication protein, II/X family [Agarivorans litoreus]|uniref:phage/plasmid replication protein, II/X family n=1 Tax=Agarivorans litoreus TaxID=1510455 RepID=UPI001FE47456|nr:phage/plasmid replication protein, II/X family [Agarivorans litoreus]